MQQNLTAVLDIIQCRAGYEAAKLLEKHGVSAQTNAASQRVYSMLLTILEAKRYQEFLSRYPCQGDRQKILRLLQEGANEREWPELAQLVAWCSMESSNHVQDSSAASNDEIRDELSLWYNRIMSVKAD